MATGDKFAVAWRKSSQSAVGTSCVEVGPRSARSVGVRDSKDPQGPAFWFSPAQWTEFVKGVRDREFAPRDV